MAADLHIHVLRHPVTEEDIADFECSTLGSKWFNMDRANRVQREREDLYELIANTPNIWVGEVSWLKAALFDSPETYVPSPIEEITSIIGEDLPVLTREIIMDILDALALDNETPYTLTTREKLETFLYQYEGERVFTVSW